MKLQVQRGIKYYEKPFHTNYGSTSEKKNAPRNECFALLFLRVNKGSSSIHVREALHELWKMYRELELGNVRDLPNNPVPAGGLSVLVGYGPKVFTIPGVNKKIPKDFKGRQFLNPSPGGPILDGSGIRYAYDAHDNLGTSEHIIVQFISETQLASYRAILETWGHIKRHNSAKHTLRLTRYFTGFQRDDGRSWLGFHDEISNMRSPRERLGAIAINVVNNNLLHRDFWTKNGTYIAFLRLEINLDLWRNTDRIRQELIVGRDKLDGTPLLGVDKEGCPIKVEGCPPASKISSFYKKFHDHPDYFNLSDVPIKNLDVRASYEALNQSHIGRMRHLDQIASTDPTSRRIFRQSYDFLEPVKHNALKPIRVGLNFVSFQNDPGRLFFILTDPNWLGGTNFGGNGSSQGTERLLSVLASGVFFVPSAEDPFPGVSIFS